MAVQWFNGFTRSGVQIANVLRRAAPVAVAAYFVVVVFGLSFLFVRSRWPALGDVTVTTIAILVAAPLGIALLWPRLTGLKAFGLEVSLARSAVQTDAELVAAITEHQYFSGVENIIEQMRTAIVHRDTEILEVNLRNGEYWWSTRLYLLAALANDYSTIQAFAFVEHGVERKFLGMCSPAGVQKAIAKAYPALAVIYSQVTGPQLDAVATDQRIRAIVSAWAAQPFAGGEEQFGGKVSAQMLAQWLSQVGQQMSSDSIDWSGVSDPHLIREIVFGYHGSHVALLRHGRLDRIVNRFGLLRRIAEQTLS